MATGESRVGLDDEEIRVLCVDDEPGVAPMVAAALERVDDQLSTVVATTPAAGIEQIAACSIDCVVSGYEMADTDGLAFLETVRADQPELPFILFPAEGSEQIASRAISAGATDYMERAAGLEQYRLLAKRISNAVSRYRAHDLAMTVHERARTVLEAAPDAILVSVDGTAVYANPAAVSLCGVGSAAELTAQPITTLVEMDADIVTVVEDGDRTLDGTRGRVNASDGVQSVDVTARQIDWEGNDGAVFVLTNASDTAPDRARTASVLGAVFEESPDGVIVTAPDGTILTYNQRFVTLWGIEETVLDTGDIELVQHLLSDTVRDPEQFTRQVDEQLSIRKPTQFEIALEDGRMLDQRVRPLDAEDGSPLGQAWFYRDVTDDRRLEREQEAVFDRMTDAVCAFDADWRFTFLNESAEELFGRSREELLGTSVWETLPDTAGTEIAEQYRHAIETQEPISVETYYETLDRHVETRVFPSETGATVYFRDVSRERTVESRLRQTVEDLETLYQIASDQDRSFEKKREQLLTFGTEYLDLPYGFVTEIDENQQQIIESVGDHDLLQPGESCPLEQSYCRKTISTKSGFLAVENAREAGWEADVAYDVFELGTYIGAKLLVDGALYGTLCFASTDPRGQEFTDGERTLVEVMARWLSYEYDQKLSQERLEQQNEQLERFAEMVSHDLRNPLNVAMTRVELLRDDSDSEHLDAIDGAHERMQDLIEDILLLARQDQQLDDRTDLALEAVASDAWADVQTDDATLTIDVTRMIHASESRLKQLFENLFRNSVEHSSTTSQTQSDDAIEHTDQPVSITVGELADGFYVEDDGPGIDPEDREQIFEEGYSTNSEGTGLGLNIVREVVRAHDWEISVTAGENGGARFEIIGV